MEHKVLKILYPQIPFIWHYYDFANIYPVKEIKNITKDEFIKLTSIKLNKHLNDILNNLNGKTEYYINKQYKSYDILYNNKNNEIYINFHTWLLKQDNINEIPNSKIDKEYSFECGIFPLIGEIKYSKNYPYKKGNTLVPAGISINSITKRRARVHELNKNGLKYNGFSPIDICNIEIGTDSPNIAFVSIIKNANINCVTLHIFRMVGDNDYNNIDFNNLLF